MVSHSTKVVRVESRRDRVSFVEQHVRSSLGCYGALLDVRDRSVGDGIDYSGL